MASKLTFAIPVEHDSTRAYENNIIVFVGKKAYTSIQAVPANTPITNESYWVETGVGDIKDIVTRITSLEDDMDDAESAISTNASNILANTGDIATLTTNLATAVQNLNDATRSIENIMISLYTPPTQS